MGGTIRAVLDLAGQLAGDYDVKVVSVMRRREEPFFAFPDGVTVVALDDQRLQLSARHRTVIRRLRRRPSVLMRPEWRPFDACSLWTDVQLARALRRRRGVLIGTHPSLNLLAAVLNGPGWVSVGQEHMHFRAHHRSVRRAMKRLYSRLDALVVLTARDAREYAERVPTPPRIAVIPNGVSATGGASASVSGTTILAAGRLTRQKGFDQLIDAFALVAAQRPQWRLRICGHGRQRERLEARIGQRNLRSVVELPGAVQDLDQEMRRAAIFVLSSRFEGFPLILLEAMSTGLPVVSFDCPTGPADLIDDRRNGLLVPAGDVETLAAAIIELTADPDLRGRLGAAAARTAAAYTVPAVGREWRELLQELGAGVRQDAFDAGSGDRRTAAA